FKERIEINAKKLIRKHHSNKHQPSFFSSKIHAPSRRAHLPAPRRSLPAADPHYIHVRCADAQLPVLSIICQTLVCKCSFFRFIRCHALIRVGGPALVTVAPDGGREVSETADEFV